MEQIDLWYYCLVGCKRRVPVNHVKTNFCQRVSRGTGISGIKFASTGSTEIIGHLRTWL
jgi:hypothetical protein